jgi:hypothetical protein
MSLHPFYVRERQRAGRKYAFRPEKQRLLDALWPVLVSFCDAGKHTVGMCVSRLARELSPKDAKGKVIPETEVTIRRVSALIAEQVRFGVLGCQKKPPGIGSPVNVCQSTCGSPPPALRCWALI